LLLRLWGRLCFDLLTLVRALGFLVHEVGVGRRLEGVALHVLLVVNPLVATLGGACSLLGGGSSRLRVDIDSRVVLRGVVGR
jgi:hypothetical protein